MSGWDSKLALLLIYTYRAVWHRIHLCLDWAGIRFRVCHFEPSCSQYALDAFSTYPLRKALVLTWFRVRRCHHAGQFHVVMPDRLVDESAESPQYEHCCGGAMSMGKRHETSRNSHQHSSEDHNHNHLLEVSPETRFKKSSSNW